MKFPNFCKAETALSLSDTSLRSNFTGRQADYTIPGYGGFMILKGMELNGQTGHEAGRQLLQELYRAQTGKPMPPICTEDRGKPYFAEGNWHFSIAHTPKHAFCALSDKPVGIDAEELDRKVDLRLADKILSATEKVYFDRAQDPNETLLRFWVLKEAAAKLSGEGLRGYPNHTNFDPMDPRIRIIDTCLVAVLEEENGKM